VFGRTLICETLKVAGEYSRSHQLNGITILGTASFIPNCNTGDKVNRKGTLTGGFYDEKSSRLDTALNLDEWRTKYKNEASQGQKTKAGIIKIDQEITKILSDIQLHEMTQRKETEACSILNSEVLILKKEEAELQELIGSMVLFFNCNVI
jgi:structural maintenance of chromosome 3 (chondroitin sulfate proteoglycan 6)